MTAFVGEKLEIPEHLKLILRGLGAVTAFAPDAPLLLQSHVAEMMRATATSAISVAMASMMSSLKCPFGSPPADIQGAFDANRTLHLECLHSNPKHCWDLSGNPRTC